MQEFKKVLDVAYDLSKRDEKKFSTYFFDGNRSQDNIDVFRAAMDPIFSGPERFERRHPKGFLLNLFYNTGIDVYALQFCQWLPGFEKLCKEKSEAKNSMIKTPEIRERIEIADQLGSAIKRRCSFRTSYQ